jgi:biotin synthase
MSVLKSSFHTAVRLQRIYVRSYSSVVDHQLPLTPISGSPPKIASGNAVQEALAANGVRQNWTREEISEIYNTSLYELQYAAVCALRIVG